MGWESIPGWFDFQDIYDQAVEEAKDGAIFVELGVAFGRSAAYLARRVIDSGKRIRIFAVDPWTDDWTAPKAYDPHNGRPTWGAEHADWARACGGPYNAFVAAMRAHAIEELERLEVLRLTSTLASRLFPTTGTGGRQIDMCFVDANHNYDGVAEDLRTWAPLVKVGGVLAGHDYTSEFPGVEQAVAELVPGAARRRTSFWSRVER